MDIFLYFLLSPLESWFHEGRDLVCLYSLPSSHSWSSADTPQISCELSTALPAPGDSGGPPSWRPSPSGETEPV